MAGPTGELVIQRKGSTVGWGLYHAIGFYAMRTTRLSVCKYLRHHKNATSARVTDVEALANEKRLWVHCHAEGSQVF